jgi:hypothetical protein
VHQGRAAFDLPCGSAGGGAATLVIVTALARGLGPFPIRLTATPTPQAEPPKLAPEPPRREVRFKPVALALPPSPERRFPAGERVFSLMVRDGDVASASNYLAIRGRLRAVGARVQVYVDTQDLGRVGDDVLNDLVSTFDGRVFPLAATTFGCAHDVDGDGRFTVLISSWLTHLASGRHVVDGYVRGADFDPCLAAPFGNRCDMMYLSTALEPGPHLRTVLAHEYTHAVTLCAKSFSDHSRGSARRPRLVEEEGWLDEALAHLVEDLHGFSRSNLDYRVSAFLSQPARYRLLVEDYYAADLFRSHGNRGATYLFLRWCADQFGPALLPALIRSEKRGTENLEAATGVPFGELFRQWSVALFLSGLDPDGRISGGPGVYRSINLRGPLEGWELAGPRPVAVAPGGAPAVWAATGTSSQFLVIESGPGAASSVAVEVSGPSEAELQVTAVPLPEAMGQLDLAARVFAAADGRRRLQASVHERQGVAVELSALAWELLVPGPNPRAAGFRCDRLGPVGLAEAFGTATLAPHGTLTARSIPLADSDGPLIVKLTGTDAGGRRISAWAEVPATAGDTADQGGREVSSRIGLGDLLP